MNNSKYVQQKEEQIDFYSHHHAHVLGFSICVDFLTLVLGSWHKAPRLLNLFFKYQMDSPNEDEEDFR